MKHLCFLSLALLLLLAPPAFSADDGPPPDKPWTGVCQKVVDGDTIYVSHNRTLVKIRLYGVDCPERGRPFSKEATAFAKAMVFAKTVRVEPVDMDRYGRTVAWIRIDGKDLSRELIRAGLGRWYRKYAPNDYDLGCLEAEASRRHRGMWAPQVADCWAE